jgi:hypothetical protein
MEQERPGMTPLADTEFWSDYLERTLQCYDEPLLRQLAASLFRPRNQWPASDLIERSLASLSNAAVIDRRLAGLEAPARMLLTLMGYSRQPRWQLGNLLELAAALGTAEGPQPVFTLFETGLLYPDLFGQGSNAAVQRNGSTPQLRDFVQWLGQAGGSGLAVFAHPLVLERAVKQELTLPDLPATKLDGAGVYEADGLEWPLRLAALWQQIANVPPRRTQTGEFFKRDLDRLRSDPVLSAPPSDNLAELPDPGLLVIAVGELQGLVTNVEGELRAAALPGAWEQGLPQTLASLWACLPHLATWNPQAGWNGGVSVGNPYPSAYLLAVLLLSRAPKDAWIDPADVEVWIAENHPYWQADNRRPSQRRSWVPAFLLGLAYQLRLVQAAKNAHGEWLVRLSPLGRWLLGTGDLPPAPPSFGQALLVQPTLEIVVYRQGLTLALIARLSRFAVWKTLGAACTLQLEAESVYRALESGLSFEALVQTLEQHGMRSLPSAVVESLRTWANKRDRITVYPSATLFEFANAEDLLDALARGLTGTRVSERMLAVSGESAVDFRHFRLTGTRDYSLPPEKCVEVEPDGVTLGVDLTRSDLLLETELARFAEPLDGNGVSGRSRYRLTPASLAAAQTTGLSQRDLEDWFQQRSGQALSAAARLILNSAQSVPPELRRRLVLQVATPDLADGLMQWPGTRSLIAERLGPTTLAVDEECVQALTERLAGLGVTLAIR